MVGYMKIHAVNIMELRASIGLGNPCEIYEDEWICFLKNLKSNNCVSPLGNHNKD